MELGLREINNCVFAKANDETLKKIRLVQDYITYGYPTKKIVNDLVRKRGFLKKDDKKLAITDNVLIEELLGCEKLGPNGCICIEDIIDCIWKCNSESVYPVFKEILEVLWPMQLGSLKETIAEANIKHDATGRDVRRKNTKTEKGGYIGFMGPEINEFVRALI
jgi:large subunit ribosomal protein L7e